MSIKTMSRVWELSEQKGAGLLCLLAIADYADDNGFAWPAIKTIATKIRMSPRHTNRILQELARERELCIIKRKANQSRLYITTVGLDENSFREAAQRAKSFGGQGDILSWWTEEQDDKMTPQDDKMSPQDDKMSPQDDIAMSYDPSLSVIEPIIETSKDRDAEKAGVELPPTENPHSISNRPEPEPAEEPLEKPPSVLEDIFDRAITAPPTESWTVPPAAGGTDEYRNGPLKAFCDLVGISLSHLPPKKAGQWAAALAKVAGTWRIGAISLTECISAVSESEFGWKAYSSPYQRSFQDDISILIGRHVTKVPLARARTTKNRRAREGIWTETELERARAEALAETPLDVNAFLGEE